jgi:DNA-binding response OmpR family regulator
MATLLLIEDDEGVRSALSVGLHRLGHVVILAKNSQEGLMCHAAAAGAFDLVICDLMLPGGGGFATIRTLHARSPELPIVAISGATHSLHYLHSTGDSPVRAILPKPFTFPDLVRIVEPLLTRRETAAALA